MESKESHLSQDVVFDVLSSPRRRYVLYYLRTVDEPVKLTDLADKVAAWENEVAPEDISEKERKRVYVSLYQTHVPRLDDAGIIQYDKESGNIVLSEEATAIDEYLESGEGDVQWEKIYLSLAAASTVLLVAIAVDLPVVGEIPEVLAAVLVISVFVATTIAHAINRRRRKRSIPPELQDRF